MKDIKGYEGLYAITSCGRVWSYRRNKFLKPLDVGQGYLQVALYKENKAERKRVHRLVAEAYLPNPENLPEVDHVVPVSKGGRNNVQNLHWISKENNLKKAKCKKIRCIETGEIFESVNAAAKKVDVGASAMSMHLHGHNKSCGGYHFEFVMEGQICD